MRHRHLWLKKTVLKTEKDEEKATNEIGVFIPAMDMVPDIAGRTITADALLTQKAIAAYLHRRGANFVFVAKGNHKALYKEITAYFAEHPSRPPDFTTRSPQPEHGRIERREIWVSTDPVHRLEFPWVEQVFMIKRHVQEYRCARNGRAASLGKPTIETVYGITSHTPESADGKAILKLNREHWSIENRVNHLLDHEASWNEDKCRVRSGYGPENLSCLRRLSICLVLARDLPVSTTIKALDRNPRRVLDWLRLSQNTQPRLKRAA